MKRFTGTTHVYKGRSGDWHWKAVATNGQNVANSGEGYTRRHRAHLYATRYGPAGFAVVIDKPVKGGAK